MTFDLGVWKSSPGLTATAASFIYSGLCQGERAPHVVAAAPAIDSFYQELTSTWPEVGKTSSRSQTKSDTPWSAPLLRTADYLLMSCEWQYAEVVLAYVTALAGQHGLTVFDPQSEEVYLPEASA